MNERSKGAIMNYLYMGVQVIVNLIYVPLLLSFIGTAEYGLYQLIGSVMAYRRGTKVLQQISRPTR